MNRKKIMSLIKQCNGAEKYSEFLNKSKYIPIDDREICHISQIYSFALQVNSFKDISSQKASRSDRADRVVHLKIY